MRPSLWYRLAAGLLLLFGIAHVAGFRTIDPAWQIDDVVTAMRRSFEAEGRRHTYWDFYVGFGLFVASLQLFGAIAAWQLARLAPATLSTMPLLRWGFVLTQVVNGLLSWRYFFPLPTVFSFVTALCLALAAWQSRAGAATTPLAPADHR